MKRKILFWSSRVLREGAWEQGRRVRNKDSLLRKEWSDLLVKINLRGLLLGHRLDDETGVAYSFFHIELELYAAVSILNLLKAGIFIKIISICDPRAPGTCAVIHTLYGFNVGGMHLVKFRPGAPYASLASEPYSHIKSAVCTLKSDLTSKYSTSGNNNFFYVHRNLLFEKCIM